MESYQIIAGFSDLKAEFQLKSGTTKSLEELQLWFSFEEDVLYVHDYTDHNVCIVLAVLSNDKNKWQIYLKKGTFGERVVVATIASAPIDKIADSLNYQYRLYGFGPFGGG